MKIGVVGLGLIGGSFCRAIKAKTNYQCFGLDREPKTLKDALNVGAIDGILEEYCHGFAAVYPMDVSFDDFGAASIHFV